MRIMYFDDNKCIRVNPFLIDYNEFTQWALKVNKGKAFFFAYKSDYLLSI